MMVRLVESQHFTTYPEAQAFIAQHNAQGYACLVTNSNEGFTVDVYEQRYAA